MRRKIMLDVLAGLVAVAMVAAGVSGALADEPDKPGREVALFAGGCFWCMEPPFEKLEGVEKVISGYTGGHVENPTYEIVTSETSGHYETVAIYFYPAKVTYEKLLDVFWRQIDPTDGGGQFVDRGPSYRSAIFYLNESQREAAEKSKATLAASGKFKDPIATQILPAKKFYPAEDYHQDYYRNNPVRYKYYRWGSGRDKFLDRVWGEGNH